MGFYVCLCMHGRGVDHICVVPQVILQTLLIKAKEKLRDGERILKEHENIDSTMAVSKSIQTTT